MKDVIRSLFQKKLTSILAGFEAQVAQLETFIELNHEKFTKQQAEATAALSEQRRAERVKGKLKDLLA